MANFNIPENPEFTQEIRKFETTDPAHADLFNSVVQALVNNDVFIKKMAEQLFKNALASSESYTNEVYQQATGYADQKIADLIGGAPSTLDTLEKIAKAMQDNDDVVEVLDAAIGSRASEAEFNSHKEEIEKMLGNTNISDIGDGTVTGALSKLNTGLEKITYPYGAMNNVLLYGFVSKKQLDDAGSPNRYIVFIPIMGLANKYGLKSISDIIVQGIVIIRQDSEYVNGFQATNVNQTEQGFFISLKASSSETPDISGYICECVFDFYKVD